MNMDATILSGHPTIFPWTVTGKGGDIYDFGEGIRVWVSRNVSTCRHYEDGLVLDAVRWIARTAIKAGMPTGDLSLMEEQYKRFLGVL
ncbi:MAG TPA: hypothetical protein VMV72_04405 [Verrucomicrobiae bacterium]|nr:hypothetical protein [Verrucomicrobiae bacterium]